MFKGKLNTPPNLSFLRDSQKKGFIIGGLYRSGLYTDPMTWKENKMEVLKEYKEGFRKKGYEDKIMKTAIRRCQFLDSKDKRTISERIE